LEINMTEETSVEQQPVGYTPVDLITHALDERPIDFADVLGSLLADRALEALDARRSEIANDLFVNDVIEPEEEQPPGETEVTDVETT